jgi:hypothetical protein
MGSVGANVGVATGGNVARAVSGSEAGNGRMNEDAANTKAPPINATATIVTTSVPVVRIAPRRIGRSRPVSHGDPWRIRRSESAAPTMRASRSGDASGSGMFRSNSSRWVI